MKLTIENNLVLLTKSSGNRIYLIQVDVSAPLKISDKLSIKKYIHLTNPTMNMISQNGLCGFLKIGKHPYSIAGEERNFVAIKCNGDHYQDKRLAWAISKIDMKKVENYALHHVDDLDSDFKCTMQLVKRGVHDPLGHTGSVKQFEELFNMIYNP